MSSDKINTETFAVVGELVMVSNAIDHLLNLVTMAAMMIDYAPMTETVVATLDPGKKVEILKARAEHISDESWKMGIIAFCKKAESVFRQRNIVCHTPAIKTDMGWSFQPVAAAKLLKRLDLKKKTARDFPFSDVKDAIKTGEAALGAGVHLLEQLKRLKEAREKKYGDYIERCKPPERG